MIINFKRILYTPIGRILMSILLGLGLASLFHRVCKEKNCIHFHGPVIKDIDHKTFQFDNKCYQYEAAPVKCDDNKKIIDFESTKSFNVDENFINYKLKFPKSPTPHLQEDLDSNIDSIGASFTQMKSE